MIFIVDSDAIMAKCIARACGKKAVRIYDNAIVVAQGLNEVVPEMIFLEVMLAGPDGFSLLNELMSYEDTMRVPVVVVTELELRLQDLQDYGVVRVLSKATMKPREIRRLVEEFTEVEKEVSA